MAAVATAVAARAAVDKAVVVKAVAEKEKGVGRVTVMVTVMETRMARLMTMEAKMPEASSCPHKLSATDLIVAGSYQHINVAIVLVTRCPYLGLANIVQCKRCHSA